MQSFSTSSSQISDQILAELEHPADAFIQMQVGVPEQIARLSPRVRDPVAGPPIQDGSLEIKVVIPAELNMAQAIENVRAGLRDGVMKMLCANGVPNVPD